MRMTRVCFYHVGQKYASDSPGIVECLATMAFECARYQVDIIAGDGNKACYYTTPKSPGVPTYQHSLIQFWINRIMGVATQAMRKIHDPTCPPIRVKHFISCSYRDLDSLATHLDGITTATYTEEHMKKTDGKGDCCMLSVVEWGHARQVYEEFPKTWTSMQDGGDCLEWISTATMISDCWTKAMKPDFMLPVLKDNLYRVQKKAQSKR